MVPDTLARPSAAKVPVATSSMHIYNIKSHFFGSQEVEIQLVSWIEIQLVSSMEIQLVSSADSYLCQPPG